MKKPIKNPVPTREMMRPRVYSKTKDVRNPGRNSRIVASSDNTKPTAEHIIKPHIRCMRVRPRKENADSFSKSWFSGSALVADSRLNHPWPAIR